MFFFLVIIDVLKKQTNKPINLFTNKFHLLSRWWNINKENICIKWMRVSLIIVYRGGSSLSMFEVTFTYILGVVIWYMKNLCIVDLLKILVMVTITTINDTSFMCENISLMPPNECLEETLESSVNHQSFLQCCPQHFS